MGEGESILSCTSLRTGTDIDFQAVSRQHLNFEIQILLERGCLNDYIKIQGDLVTHKVLSKIILMAKTMRKKNLKIQMVAGNSLNSFSDETCFF